MLRSYCFKSVRVPALLVLCAGGAAHSAAAQQIRTTPLTVATRTAPKTPSPSTQVTPKLSNASRNKKPTPSITTAPVSTQKTRMASEESPEWFPATLIIPALNVQAPVVRGVDDKTMRGGVGFDPDSSAPHQIGNTVIAGHRNIWGSYFWYLPRLQKGDEVMLVTPKKKFVYTVEYSQIVQPHQTDVLETDEKSKNSHLTLYTCTKPKTECRFVVRARLKETFELTQKEFLALHKDVPAHPVNTRRPPSLPEKKTPIRLTEKK